MTKDEIMKMARDAGAPDPMVFIGAYELFASLVASAEREACAKLCDDEAEQLAQCAGSMTTGAYDWKADGATDCAEAIRARSQK